MAINFNDLSDRQLSALDLKRCPYNRSHTMKRHRYAIHVTHCYDQMDPTERDRWTVCPFNDSHRVLKDDLHVHVVECPSNGSVVLAVVHQMNGYSRADPIAIKPEEPDIDVKPDVKPKLHLFDTNGNDLVESVVTKEEKAVKSERKVMDEWSTKSVYDKPFISVYEMDIKTAEQLMAASNPMDTSALQKLSKYQRKRFYTMRVQNIQNHQNEGPIPPKSPPEPAPTRDPTSRYFWSHFRPNLTISFWSEDNSRSVSIKPEIKPEIKLETKPKIKSETNGGRARGGEGLTRDRIYKSLHSVEEYVDYHKLIQKEANMRGENNDSAITRCLRNTELTPEDRNEIQVLCEKPLRKPTTRPFEAKLRRPTIKAEAKDE